MEDVNMKRTLLIAVLLTVAGWGVYHFARAAETTPFQTFEYITIRWGGRDNTHLIRANGKVEMLGSLLNTVARPDRVDDRAFYLNIAMNAAAKEGYEFAGMTS